MELILQPTGMSRGELKATAAYLTALADMRGEEANCSGKCTTEAVKTQGSIAPVVEPATVFRQEQPVPVELAGEPTVQALPDDYRDSEGLPWDARIHASSKALVADGSWRKKRGVDDALVAQVTAELRAASQVGLPAAPAVPVPPAPSATIPVPPPPTVPPAPTDAPAAPQTITFAQVLPRISAAVTAGTLDMPTVLAACQKAGIPALPALAGMQHLIPQVMADLGLPLTEADGNG